MSQEEDLARMEERNSSKTKRAYNLSEKGKASLSAPRKKKEVDVQFTRNPESSMGQEIDRLTMESVSVHEEAAHVIQYQANSEMKLAEAAHRQALKEADEKLEAAKALFETRQKVAKQHLWLASETRKLLSNEAVKIQEEVPSNPVNISEQQFLYEQPITHG